MHAKKETKQARGLSHAVVAVNHAVNFLYITAGVAGDDDSSYDKAERSAKWCPFGKLFHILFWGLVTVLGLRIRLAGSKSSGGVSGSRRPSSVIMNGNSMMPFRVM